MYRAASAVSLRARRYEQLGAGMVSAGSKRARRRQGIGTPNRGGRHVLALGAGGAAQTWVEDVAQGVAQKVPAEHHEADRHAREDDEVRVLRAVVEAILQVEAPAGLAG